MCTKSKNCELWILRRGCSNIGPQINSAGDLEADYRDDACVTRERRVRLSVSIVMISTIRDNIIISLHVHVRFPAAEAQPAEQVKVCTVQSTRIPSQMHGEQQTTTIRIDKIATGSKVITIGRFYYWLTFADSRNHLHLHRIFDSLLNLLRISLTSTTD